MNRFLFAVALAFVGATLLVGCNRQSTGAAAGSEAIPVPQFSAKNGLWLPEQTRQSLGMKLVEVTERKLASSMNIQLRVYRTEATTAFASGTIAPEEAKSLKPGRSVEIHSPDGGKQTAKVTSMSDALQGSTGSLEVLVEIPGISDSLAVGAFVQASSTTESKGSVVTIPRPALLGCSEGEFVYTVSGEHLVRTAVKVGSSNEEFVEITDGLYAGDQVVLEPVLSLWMTELAAVKGGQACCVEPPKGK